MQQCCKRCVIGCIGCLLEHYRGAPEKVVEQKGVGVGGLGTQNKKPKKIWVIHVNTPYKNKVKTKSLD